MRGNLVAVAALLILVGCKDKNDLNRNGEWNDAASPRCGNQIVEDGETCDGDCHSCDDSNACTKDIVMGSAETCDVSCGREVVADCMNGDGCCPAGCNYGSDDDCSASCGNGYVDPNETCDPADTCVTACNDNDACTTDLLTGSSGNCNAQCTTSDVVTCVNGDGCCPPACNANTDTDCSPSCGNGVVESNETCDPKASCPTMCNDNNACTTNVLMGSSTTCNAVCSYPPITMCANNDGCCPAGCYATTDNDCTPMCGNSVVEPTETCDPAATCPTMCNDNNACTTNVLSGSAATCNAKCTYPAITTCTNSDGCCPTGCNANNDNDCSASCGNGVKEGAETCDPQNTCPTMCNDNNACTSNVLTGSSTTCNAVCTYPAITTCTNNDGCCPTGCTYANDNNCMPPATTPLDQRIATKTFTAAGGVKTGDGNWRIWGYQNLGIAPVYTIPYPDCGTLIGYTTTTSSVNTARVTRLDASDGLVTTHNLGTFVIRGLAVEADGHFAALLWQPDTATPNNSKLFVRRYDKNGVQLFSTELDNTNAAANNFTIGESRLEYDVPNNRYGAYFHVHGKPGYFADGHEGDALFWVTTAGAATLGWQWGCSHSMSELLRYSPAANLTLPVCATDCYPGTSGGNFATDSIGGIYLNHTERKVRDFDGGCNGSVATEIGGASPGAVGWKLVFNGHQNAATNGQMSYSTSTMNQDIGFQAISNTKTLTGSIVWLTSTSGVNEANASIARWLPAGDSTEQYVVGWTSAPTGGTYYLGRINATGGFIEGPLTITTAQWGRRDDPFRTQLNGDIVWAWFDSAGSTTLRFARISSGGTASCAAL